MAGMGYSLEYREKVLKAAMVGYVRVLTQTKQGKTLRNRTGKCTLLKRRIMKLVGAAEWFKVRETEPNGEFEFKRCSMKGEKKKNGNGGDHRYSEAVLKIPHTPGGILKANLTKLEQELGFKNNVRYTEELLNPKPIPQSNPTGWGEHYNC